MTRERAKYILATCLMDKCWILRENWATSSARKADRRASEELKLVISSQSGSMSSALRPAPVVVPNLLWSLLPNL